MNGKSWSLAGPINKKIMGNGANKKVKAPLGVRLLYAKKNSQILEKGKKTVL